MYSAPTIASANATGVRFNVDRNSLPPGFSNVAQAAITRRGSGTCSSISMQVIDVERARLFVGERFDADFAGSRRSTPYSSRCSLATSSTAGARSIAVTFAPARASASLSSPPPQPTSSTRAPRNVARSAT